MSEQAISGGHGSVWDQVVGQDRAVAQLLDAAARGPVHAYLFVGPSGSTKLPAARAFAAHLISGGDDADQRDARLILLGTHPDVREFRRAGPSISAEQAPRDRQGVVARADRGRPQGADPRRVPPAAAGRGGADAEDDRGTATVDDVPDPLRLRAERSHHDLVALRTNRLPSHRHRRDHRTPGRRRCRAGRRGHGRDRIARRHRPGARARQRRTARRTTGGIRPRPAPLERHGFGRHPHRGRAAGDDRRRGRTADRASRAGDRRPRRADRARTATGAADASSWRSATSANSAVTAPTSCGPGWRRSPGRTATASRHRARPPTSTSAPRRSA